MINFSSIYATELATNNTTMPSMFIKDGVIQRNERITIEGYELPEEINHDIYEINKEALSLIEKISVCGKTTDFYMNIDNTSNSTIPCNYINMLSSNYTPFTFYLKKDNRTIGTIYTNAVTLESGDFPVHVELAQGVDYLQLSFETDAVFNGSCILTLDCSNFIGKNFSVYENNSVTHSSKVEADGMVKLLISNTNSKTLYFTYPTYENKATEDEKINDDAIMENNSQSIDDASDTQIATQKSVNSMIIIPLIICGVIIIAILILIGVKKK